MKVKDLIKELEKYDKETIIYFEYDNEFYPITDLIYTQDQYNIDKYWKMLILY